MNLNQEVTQFLDELNHPFRNEIEQLRLYILDASSELTETIKWNGPNYSVGEDDRITMKIHPPKSVQLIFHRGVKKQTQPATYLIEDPSKFLTWKENDRAVATFTSMKDVENNQSVLTKIVKDWLQATT